MTDLIYTHISARVPGPDEHFLINAFGLTWDEITASSLVKVNLDGEIIDDPTGLGINRAGYVIHSAVHRARPDVACVMHTHTAAGIAVSARNKACCRSPSTRCASMASSPSTTTRALRSTSTSSSGWCATWACTAR
jgi:ribulose-5-phosphate 4-epimerase/fuculose-1-phosphate aldolase